jgi:hypothetical protein
MRGCSCGGHAALPEIPVDASAMPRQLPRDVIGSFVVGDRSPSSCDIDDLLGAGECDVQPRLE